MDIQLRRDRIFILKMSLQVPEPGNSDNNNLKTDGFSMNKLCLSLPR
jgi:hypothetical protein